MPYTFRPFRGRVIAHGAIFVLVVLTAIAYRTEPGGDLFAYVWRVTVPVLTLILSAILAVVARPKAIAEEAGLTVVNMVRSRRLAWNEIIAVRFGAGAPWVTLDISDGSALPVLGIQASDGARAQREARKLADFVIRMGSGQ